MKEYVFSPELPGETPGYKLTARDVLDLHATLRETISNPRLKPLFERYAFADIEGHPEWAASHLSPATDLRDLGPWFSSLSSDLQGATTYQVTSEMVALAKAIQHASPDSAEITPGELPSDSGFMWLDKPVPRPSEDDHGLPPLEFHAISWQLVPEQGIRMMLEDGESVIYKQPAVRIREWGYTSNLKTEPRPLYLIGQTTLALGGSIHTRMPAHLFLRTLWLLMGMEIVTSTTEQPDRHGRKRASALRHQNIHVIHLRRHKKTAAHDEPHRQIDWSCTWIVRGHWRHAPDHGTFADGRTRTWVKPYLKGPDGAPLKASDVLYRLSQ